MLLISPENKNELIAYFRFLAVKAKFDYFVNKVQFSNAKGFFMRIIDTMYKQKDYLMLGYFVYFTQYFSSKKEEAPASGGNPFEEEEEYDNFFETGSEEDKEAEAGENDNSRDKENKEPKERDASFNESMVSNRSMTKEEISRFLDNSKYTMMVDSYYAHAFASDTEYWNFILGQIFKVNLLGFRIYFVFRRVRRECTRKLITRSTRTS